MKVMKKIIILIIVAALLAAAAAASLFLTEYLDTTSSDGETVTVVIPEGAAGKAMAGILKDN